MLFELLGGGTVEITSDKSHRYCIGFRNSEGNINQGWSYETKEKLERGYIGWVYLSDGIFGLGEPIPFERNGSRGTVLNDIVEKHKSCLKLYT